jgi:hypothetical protein
LKFNYLDVVLIHTGNFKKAKQCQIDEAIKALYDTEFKPSKKDSRSLIYIAKRKGLQVFSLSHTITTRKII